MSELKKTNVLNEENNIYKTYFISKIRIEIDGIVLKKKILT